jgi:hypothetical protein
MNDSLDLLPGDLLLVRGSGAVDALIRFGERVRYHGWRPALAKSISAFLHRRAAPEDPSDPAWVNHVGVYVGNGQLIEAESRGLVRSPVTKYSIGTYKIARLDQVRAHATDDERTSLVAFADEQLRRHDSYGWLSIASIVLQLLTPTKLDISWDGALICSAFAAQCWEHAGVILTTRSSLTTMPADLLFMTERQPH